MGLRTDASSRFEKGLPREVTLPAADRAVQLLQDLCGATVEGRWLHERPLGPQDPLRLRRDALHNLLGPVLPLEAAGVAAAEPEDLEDAVIERILTALGCQLSADGDDGWLVQVPPRGPWICSGRWT